VQTVPELRYSAVDYAILGVVAAVMGVVFVVAWDFYYLVKALLGPIGARVFTYGIWFMAAPLAASLIRKPLSAFSGEALAALVETIIPTYGGYTNLIYGVAQGLASELAYLIFGYRRWGPLQAALSGALAGPVAVTLDQILFPELITAKTFAALVLAAIASGALYGLIAYGVSRVRK